MGILSGSEDRVTPVQLAGRSHGVGSVESVGFQQSDRQAGAAQGLLAGRPHLSFHISGYISDVKSNI
jgi:hypothetical protein